MASYLQSTRDFLYRRRRPFIVLGGIAGGVYMAASYAVSKLSEMQQRMVEERRDRENLRRRFAQNQEDCTFTVLALLPTLGDQLFGYMDVEGLTEKLQKGRLATGAAAGSEAQTPAASAPVAAGAAAPSSSGNGAKEHAATPAPGAAPVDAPRHADDHEQRQQDETKRSSASNGNLLDASGSTASSCDAMEEVWTKLGSTKDAGNHQQQQNGIQQADSELAKSTAHSHDAQTTQNGLAANGYTINGDLQTGEGNQTSSDDTAPSTTMLDTSALKNSHSHSSNLDAVSEPAPRPISSAARLTPSPQPSPTITDGEKQEATPGVAIAHANDAPTSPLRHAFTPTETHTENEIATTPALEQQISQHPASPSPEEIVAERRAKLALWNDLKSAAISRTMTTLYGAVLLSLQTHVQLNLLGRYAYLTSVSSLSSTGPAPSNHQIRIESHDDDDEAPQDGDDDNGSHVRDEDESPSMKGIDMQTERLYLTLSWWFLHRGWRQLADVVQAAVDEVFSDVSLKAPLSHADFVSLLRKVRRRVEYEGRGRFGGLDDDATTLGASMASFDARSEWSEATTARSGAGRRAHGRRRDFSGILFPPAGHEVQVLLEAGAVQQASLPPVGASLASLSPVLPALLDETRDILESDDFWRVFKLGLRHVFSTFESELRPTFGLPPLPLPLDMAQQQQQQQQQQHGAAADATIREVDDAAAEAFARANSDDARAGKTVRLASLFPVVARQSKAAIHGTPNPYIDALANIKELRAFCAVIYAAWE